mgnify:CR=1 FL=1
MKNKKLLLAATSIMTAGVIAAGASSTVAWFVLNRTVTLDVNTISLQADGDLKIKFGGTLCGYSLAGTLEDFGSAETVDADGYKITATSSENGSSVVKMKQDGLNVTFKDATNDTSLSGDKWTKDYLQFYITFENSSEEDLEIYLDGVKTSIVGSSTKKTANTMARVAIDTVVLNAAPSAKASSSAVVFMDGSAATKGNYVTKDDEGVLNPDMTDWDTAPTTRVASDLIKDINDSTEKYEETITPTGGLPARTDESTPTKGWAVVTIWFEGTEEVNQNHVIKDEEKFNVHLAFAARAIED